MGILRPDTSTFDVGPEVVQGLVPLTRDPVEVLARLRETLRRQLPDSLTSAAAANDQACFGKHLEMLRDRLAGHQRLRGEPRNGLLPPRREAKEQPQPCLVPKLGRKRGKVVRQS